VSGPSSLFLQQPSITYCQNTPSNNSTSICHYVATSPHTAGINAALGDGSVRFVAAGISGNTWWAACTPRGGEVLGNDWSQ
jgi:hypothetical protein